MSDDVKRSIKESSLIELADSLRQKTGSEDKIEWQSLVTSIKSAIESSGASAPNGKEWTLSNITDSMRCAKFANGLWVACGANGLYYSEDNGKTWTQSVSTSGTMFCVEYYHGRWYSGGNKELYYSDDGKTWKEVTSLDTSLPNIYTILCMNTGSALRYLAVGVNGIWYSTNGTSWTASSTSFTASSGNGARDGAVALNTCSVVATDGGIYYTTNATSFTSVSTTTSYKFKVIRSANGINIAADDAGGIWYSVSGKSSWSKKTTLTTAANDIYFAEGLWVVTYDGGVAYSINGTSWTAVEFTGFGVGKAVCHANGVWCVGGATGLAYSFTDVKSLQMSNLTENVIHIAFGNGMWIASTGAGIYYSQAS